MVAIHDPISIVKSLLLQVKQMDKELENHIHTSLEGFINRNSDPSLYDLWHLLVSGIGRSSFANRHRQMLFCILDALDDSILYHQPPKQTSYKSPERKLPDFEEHQWYFTNPEESLDSAPSTRLASETQRSIGPLNPTGNLYL